MLNTQDKTAAIVAALEDIKAQDIEVIDTSKLSPLFERMIIASAQSTRQTKALSDNVEKKLKALGEEPLSVEGEQSGEWILVDFGEVLVHIMQPAVRAYYNLEELWSAPKRVPRKMQNRSAQRHETRKPDISEAAVGLRVFSMSLCLVAGFMKLLILAVGNKMPSWITEGFNEYAKRMPREATISLIEIKPEARNSGKTAAQIMEAEAQRIRAALPAAALCIALDERGATPTTKQLTQQMQDWMQQGRDVAFIIGGADGLHESVKQQAQQLMALSAFTLPHGMVRVLLAEQLYRAHSLMHNHPYHRE